MVGELVCRVQLMLQNKFRLVELLEVMEGAEALHHVEAVAWEMEGTLHQFGEQMQALLTDLSTLKPLDPPCSLPPPHYPLYIAPTCPWLRYPTLCPLLFLAASSVINKCLLGYA